MWATSQSSLCSLHCTSPYRLRRCHLPERVIRHPTATARHLSLASISSPSANEDVLLPEGACCWRLRLPHTWHPSLSFSIGLFFGCPSKLPGVKVTFRESCRVVESTALLRTRDCFFAKMADAKSLVAWSCRKLLRFVIFTVREHKDWVQKIRY